MEFIFPPEDGSGGLSGLDNTIDGVSCCSRGRVSNRDFEICRKIPASG